MSAIAKDASVTLITAVPGSGKTLRAVWYMREAVAAGELVFACNVNGLKLQGVTPFPDPTKWQDLPKGSVLIVDECQQFFRQGRAVPDYIAGMETIRHLGIRLVLLTQHSGLIHGNINKLVGRHEHMVRENGKESSIVYTRSRLIANTGSDKTLAAEDHHTWAFPKDCYDLYESAEVHTVKRTIPHKYRRAAIFVGIAALLLFYVVRTIGGELDSEPEGQAHAAAATQQLGPASRAVEKRLTTASDYAESIQPLIADAPFTAPGFVNRAFVSDPELFCMSSGYMKGKVWILESCTCMTEQGTRYDLDQQTCGKVARDGGRYNPYKPRSNNAQDASRTAEEPTGAGRSPAVTEANASAPLIGVARPFATVASYGEHGLQEGSSLR